MCAHTPLVCAVLQPREVTAHSSGCRGTGRLVRCLLGMLTSASVDMPGRSSDRQCQWTWWAATWKDAAQCVWLCVRPQMLFHFSLNMSTVDMVACRVPWEDAEHQPICDSEPHRTPTLVQYHTHDH